MNSSYSNLLHYIVTFYRTDNLYYSPGRMRFFSISVPVAVALMRQTLAASRAA